MVMVARLHLGSIPVAILAVTMAAARAAMVRRQLEQQHSTAAAVVVAALTLYIQTHIMALLATKDAYTSLFPLNERRINHDLCDCER